MIDSGSSMQGLLPDGRVERLADTKADADANADNEKNDEDLGNDLVAGAQPGEAAAPAALHLGRLGLLLPVVLAGPHAVVALTAERVPAHGNAPLTAGVETVGRCVGIIGLEVALEGVDVLLVKGTVAGSGRPIILGGAGGCDVGESRLLGEGDGGHGAEGRKGVG